MTVTAPDIGHAFDLEPKDAVAFLAGKGAQVTGPWNEWLDGQHARAFTVANVAKLDVLQDIQASLVQALKSGQTLQQWKDGLIPQLQKKGWWQRDATTAQLKAAGRVDQEGVIAKGLTPKRLETIFQTNMQSAYMAGRYNAMIDQAAERPYWEYVAILDSRTRPAHRALNGRVFRYDDAAWQAFYPPNGYRCRCRVRNFTQTEISRRGMAVSSSEGKLRQISVPQKDGTSATVTRLVDKSLPGGKFQPDPGFSNNPALSVWSPRLEPMDVQLSRLYIDTVVQGPAFEQFVHGKAQGVVPVAVLRPEDQAQLKASTSVAYISSQTVAKQLAHHPELTLDDYRRIPAIIDQAEVYLDKNQYTLLYLFPGETQAYRLVLKATVARHELYVVSLAKVSEDKARANMANKAGRLR